MCINVAWETVEAAESRFCSFWYISEGNGWNLFSSGLGETSCKGCLYNPWTLKDIFLNFISKLGWFLFTWKFKFKKFKIDELLGQNPRPLNLQNYSFKGKKGILK